MLQDSELASLQSQLHSLQESHSSLRVSSEQQATTHQRALSKLGEKGQRQQEELSRTRAQVASLSSELAAERKMVEELRGQVTLARAEAARHQAQVERDGHFSPFSIT